MKRYRGRALLLVAHCDSAAGNSVLLLRTEAGAASRIFASAARLLPMPSHLVSLAPTSPAASERAGELLSELDEWFDVSPSVGGKPLDGPASVEVGGHILDFEAARAEVVARLDQIDPTWRASLSVLEPEPR